MRTCDDSGALCWIVCAGEGEKSNAGDLRIEVEMLRVCWVRV